MTPGSAHAADIVATPEFRFLASSIAWPRTPERSARLAGLAIPSLDWDRLLRLAERHRVVGLLHHSVAQAAIHPPEPMRAQLAARGQAVALQELGLAAELTRLQQAFAARDVQVTVLKGLAAALQGFGRIGLRQNRDIDLLLAPTSLAEAVSALHDFGYDQVEPDYHLDPTALARWMRTHKDLVFRHPVSAVIVELHWRLFDNRHYTADLPEAQTTSLRLPTGAQVRALGPEAAFLYMSSHGAQHAWSRLKWLADFGALTAGFDAAQLVACYEAAKRQGCGRAAGQGLLLLADLLELLIPEALLREARRDWHVRALRSMALRSMAHPGDGELEDQTFGSTVKTLSHYLLTSRLRYWWSEAAYDLFDLPEPASSPLLRALGPLAKAPLWLSHRLHRRRPI